MEKRDKKMVTRVAIASLMGTTIEWYDFFLYGIVAGLVFSKLYFPTEDPYIGVILAYSTFAIGYLARPLGGFIFGHYGDRLGRKSMLVITLMIMGIATIGIGLVPTYASIGIWAPIILQLLRLCQGLGLGGEWGGAVLMTYEHASEKERGFYASIPQIGLGLGLCIATGVVALLSSTLTDAQFMDWGWRVAFIGSIVLVVIGLWIRVSIVETPDFQKVKEKQPEKQEMPIVQVVKRYPKSILLGIGARWIDGVFFNVFAVFSITYMTNILGVARIDALLGVMVASIVMCFGVPYYGKLADRLGRGTVYGWGSVACLIVAAPAFWVMQNFTEHVFVIWMVLTLCIGFIYSAVFGTQAALFSDLFDADVRYTGISVVYQFPGFFVAGIVPAVCTSLLAMRGGDPLYVCFYVIISAAVSAWCAFKIEQRHREKVAKLAK